MPLKRLKQETADALTLQWILHVKDYKLTHDKNHCTGCQICSLACPKEAIKLMKQPKTGGEKPKRALVDIDLSKCNFCGMCDVLCPYGAMKVTIDGDHILNLVEKESFPQLVRDIQVDSGKAAKPNKSWEEACPLDLIKVTWQTANGKPVHDLSSLSAEEKQGVHAKVEIEKVLCPCCRVCEFKLPKGVVHVRKFLQGKITIRADKCPEGCTDCLDICPITEALYLSEADKKVHPNEMFCIYCGACKDICPVDEALELKRTKINHTPIKSGAWNKALERLTSPVDMTKELKTKGSLKAKESVKKRMALKEA